MGLSLTRFLGGLDSLLTMARGAEAELGPFQDLRGHGQECLLLSFWAGRYADRQAVRGLEPSIRSFQDLQGHR